MKGPVWRNFSVLGAWLALVAPRTIDVKVQHEALDHGVATCEVANRVGQVAPERLVRQATGHWQWSLLKGDTLRCDADDGHEPADVRAQDVDGDRLALKLSRGRAVEVQAGPYRRVQWVETAATPNGEGACIASERIVAARRLSSPVAVLHVAPRDRLLRFFGQPGVSPVTLMPEESAVSRLVVPPPVPGGELFGVFSVAGFQPQRLSLTHNASRFEVPAQGRHFQRAGIPPGTYQSSMDYEGGVRQPGPEIKIAAGATTACAPLRLPDTGAAVIGILDFDTQGHDEFRFVLARAIVEARSSRREVVVTRPFDPGITEQQFEGLTPGDYAFDISEARTGTLLASATFAIVAHRSTSVQVTRSLLWLSGAVTLKDGTGMPGLSLAISEADGQREVRTTTDDQGRYAVALPEMGRYAVAVNADGYLPIVTRSVVVSTRETTLDIVLPGGVIEIAFTGVSDQELAAGVQLSLAGPIRRAGFVFPRSRVVRLVGLAEGEYSILASTPGGWVASQESRVAVQEGAAAARLSIELVKRDAVFRVVGPDGSPLPGAEVTAAARIRPGPDAGVFLLSGLRAGAHVSVKAPAMVPACRVSVQTEEVVRMRPDGGFHLEILVSGSNKWDAFGLLDGLAGSTCPVPVSLLRTQVSGQGSTVVRVLGLPPGRYRYLLRDFSELVDVPGPPLDLRSGPP